MNIQFYNVLFFDFLCLGTKENIGNIMNKLRNVIVETGLPLIYRSDTPNLRETDILPNKLKDATRVFATSLSGFQKEAHVVSSGSNNLWRLVSDEGANLAGHDAAPPPLGYFSAGLVASYFEEIIALAKQKNVTIEHLHLTVDNFYTMEGSMPKGTMQGGAHSVVLTVDIICDLAEPKLTSFLSDAISASPLNDLVRSELDNLFTLTKNGNRIRTENVTESTSPAAINQFSTTQPPAPDDLTLLTKIGPSPASKTYPAEKQLGEYSTDQPSKRPLHVAATCELNSDGLKEIYQQLHFPHGSEWLFLSEELNENDNSQRAPDANTLLATGVGFCFMTQLGILAKTQKRNLANYEIIQDMQFSKGGASGATGLAGKVAPIETHLTLNTDETDTAACKMLDQAEIACFLHGLCKTSMKTKIRLSNKF